MIFLNMKFNITVNFTMSKYREPLFPWFHIARIHNPRIFQGNRYVLMGSTEPIKFAKRVCKPNTCISSAIVVIYECKIIDYLPAAGWQIPKITHKYEQYVSTTDIALNFEKSIPRSIFLHHFKDIALDFEKSIARVECFHHFQT